MSLRIEVASILVMLASSIASAGVAGSQAQPKQDVIRQIDAERSAIDRSLGRYRVVEKDFLEYSTEGGSLKAYLDGDEVRKIVATFYGHSLRSDDEYYYSEGEELVYASREVQSDA